MARTNKYTSLNFNDIYEKKIINPKNNNNPSKSSSSSSSSSSHKSYSLSASSRIHGNMLVLSRPSPKPQPQPQLPPPHLQNHQHPPSQNLNQQHPPPQIQNQQFPQLQKVTHPSSQLQNYQFPQLHKVNLNQQQQRPHPHPHPHPQGENHQFPQLHKAHQQQQQQQPHPQPQNQQTKQPPASIQSAKPADSDTISLRPQGKTGGTSSFQETKVDVGPAKGNNKFVPPHLRPGFVARETPSVPVTEFQRPKHGNYRPGSAHGSYHGSPNRFAEDGRPKTGGGYERRMRAAGPVESDMVVMDRPRSGGSRPSSSGWGPTTMTFNVHEAITGVEPHDHGKQAEVLASIQSFPHDCHTRVSCHVLFYAYMKLDSFPSVELKVQSVQICSKDEELQWLKPGFLVHLKHLFEISSAWNLKFRRRQEWLLNQRVPELLYE